MRNNLICVNYSLYLNSFTDVQIFRLEYNEFSMVAEHRYAEELYKVFKRQAALSQLIKLRSNKEFLKTNDASVFLDNYEDQHADFR